MKFFSKNTLMFTIFFIGSCVLLRSAPLHESINLANADDFVEAARGKYPQLNSLFDFLSQSLMDLRDDVLKARSEKIAKNIKCYVPSCEDFPTFFLSVRKKTFQAPLCGIKRRQSL